MKFLITFIHDSDFKTSTSNILRYLILHLYTDVGVPISHCDILHTQTRMFYIGLIRDKVNVAHRGKGLELSCSFE